MSSDHITGVPPRERLIPNGYNSVNYELIKKIYCCRKPKNEPEEEQHPKLKVEMQTIRLNSDSQKLVLDTLKFIHGPDFKLGSASVYKVS